jgi:hypothetical protein
VSKTLPDAIFAVSVLPSMLLAYTLLRKTNSTQRTNTVSPYSLDFMLVLCLLLSLLFTVAQMMLYLVKKINELNQHE